MTQPLASPLPAPVVIVDYDPEWPRQFNAVRQVLATALGELALTIEHVGSTSVPGLAAKPILDIDVALHRLEDLPEVINHLTLIGYTHQGDLGIPTREAFTRQGDDVPCAGSGRAWMAQHLYVCHPNSPEMARHLALRNYLRAHPDAACQYSALKKHLAAQFGSDREAYTNAKSAFILGLLHLAQNPSP